MPTGAGNVAEDMITDTEVHHTLKFGLEEDVRRGACNVGDETGFAPSRIFLSWIRVCCHVANEESPHQRGVSSVHTDPQSVQCISMLKLVVARNVHFIGIQRVLVSCKP